MAAKPDYTYQIIDEVLCITDLDKGGMSVTNCIEDIVKGIDYPPEYPVIYKDSDGMWDGFDVAKGAFYAIQSTILLEAIELAKAVSGAVERFGN